MYSRNTKNLLMDEEKKRKQFKTIFGGFSGKVDYATPQKFFDKVNKEFNFTLDVCATEENAKCNLFFDVESDGLRQQWNGVIWCNPPYGANEITKWLSKGLAEIEHNNNCKLIVFLLPSRTGSKWFHEMLKMSHIAEIRFIEGHLTFDELNNSASFGSLLLILKKQKQQLVITTMHRD